jgi:hypothetical protein
VTRVLIADDDLMRAGLVELLAARRGPESGWPPPWRSAVTMATSWRW